MALWINQDEDGGGKCDKVCHCLCWGCVTATHDSLTGVHSAPRCWPTPVAKQTNDSPSSTDSITYGVRTNDLSRLEVRLRKLIALISEQTNQGVFLSTAWPSELSDDHSKGSVMRGHFVLAVLGEGYHQGLHSVYCPQQPLTDFPIAMCSCRPGDNWHATRQCSPRNISFLQR